jgi:hypothetical protein
MFKYVGVAPLSQAHHHYLNNECLLNSAFQVIYYVSLSVWSGFFPPLPPFFFKAEYYYIVQVGLELAILLPQSLKCWDYRCAPSYLALSTLKKCITKLMPKFWKIK